MTRQIVHRGERIGVRIPMAIVPVAVIRDRGFTGDLRVGLGFAWVGWNTLRAAGADNCGQRRHQGERNRSRATVHASRGHRKGRLGVPKRSTWRPLVERPMWRASMFDTTGPDGESYTWSRPWDIRPNSRGIRLGGLALSTRANEDCLTMRP